MTPQASALSTQCPAVRGKALPRLSRPTAIKNISPPRSIVDLNNDALRIRAY